MAFRPDQARDCFEKASRMLEAHPDTHLELAVQYERSHQLEKALDSVSRYLQYHGNTAEGLILKARILRRSGEAATASELYEVIATNSSAPEVTQSQALNEWANVLDYQGDYDGAFLRLSESKRILLPLATGTRQQSGREQGWLNHQLETMSPSLLEKWIEREDGQNHESVLLTGCPRSGTTLIEKVLDAHDGVVSADELNAFSNYILPNLLDGKRDEQGFFDAGLLDHLSEKELLTAEKRYARYLEEAMDEKVGSRVLIDKNPSMTFLIPATLRVWPKNKILYALRDPRDIAVSCFFRWLPMNTVSVRYLSMEDTLKRTSEELSAWLKIREMLPAERWSETRYEDTVADSSQESKRLFEWMGLRAEDCPKNYREHLLKRGVNSPTYEAVNKPIYKSSMGRWKNYQKQLEPHLPILQSCLEKFGYD